MAGKHGSKVNLGNATHDDNVHHQSGSNKTRPGRAASKVSGKESGGAKCAPCYEGADALAENFESAFLRELPDEDAND